MYTFEHKLHVVELYLSSEISYQDLALQEGITNHSMIANWVNRFRVAGPEALRPHKRGRSKNEYFKVCPEKGNCLDNSVMENFFGLLKQEIYYGVVYYSYEKLKSEIERFIIYYNEKRIKEKLGWMSPVQYRLHLLTA